MILISVLKIQGKKNINPLQYITYIIVNIHTFILNFRAESRVFTIHNTSKYSSLYY